MEDQKNLQVQIQKISDEMHQMRSMLISIHEALSESKNLGGELEYCYSLLQATIESTIDGILVVDSLGKVTSYNKRFTEMWHIPNTLVEMKDDDKLLTFVVDQIKDPEAFLTRVRELYRNQNSESFDMLEFKDGRKFERFSKPQSINGRTVGRVWSFRDVTDRVRSENLLRNLTSRQSFLSSATNTLIRSIDVADMKKSIRRILIPRLADAYSIDLVRNDESLYNFDFNYPDILISELANDTLKKFPHNIQAITGIPRVLRTGKAEIFSETSDQILHDTFPNSAFKPVLEKVKIYSIMMIPMIVRGKTIGVLTLMSSNPERHFNWEDLRLCEEICIRITLTLDNALMHAETRKSLNGNKVFQLLKFLKNFKVKQLRSTG